MWENSTEVWLYSSVNWWPAQGWGSIRIRTRKGTHWNNGERRTGSFSKYQLVPSSIGASSVLYLVIPMLLYNIILFVHSIVCTLIYGFWLSPFGIFKLFLCKDIKTYNINLGRNIYCINYNREFNFCVHQKSKMATWKQAILLIQKSL